MAFDKGSSYLNEANSTATSSYSLPGEGAEHSAGEARLAAEVLLGDRKAIGEFVLGYSDCVFSFLYRRCDDRAVVEDLCQEVFLIAWSKLDSFDGRSSLKTWLCGIAQHKVIDHYRKQILMSPFDEEEDSRIQSAIISSSSDVETAFDRRVQEERIRETLLMLPEGYRAVLRWRYWDDKSLEQISTDMGRTVKAVERLLARARANFAVRWNEGSHARQA